MLNRDLDAEREVVLEWRHIAPSRVLTLGLKHTAFGGIIWAPLPGKGDPRCLEAMSLLKTVAVRC